MTNEEKIRQLQSIIKEATDKLFELQPIEQRKPGRQGKIKFCGSKVSTRDLADHPANVHGLSYKAIGARIKGGMKPLEALTTPRLRKDS